jgi:hypothetical protein
MVMRMVFRACGISCFSARAMPIAVIEASTGAAVSGADEGAGAATEVAAAVETAS